MSDPTGQNRPTDALAVSVIVPLLDEAATLVELHRQLRAVADREGYAMQVVFVDDGSRDNSWQVISELAAADPQVVGVRFRRNFGKADALDAGFRAATSPYVATIDADLQDDPNEIPALLAKLRASGGGFDVVSGWKIDRKDPWHKRWPSLAFNALASWLTGVHLHDHNCGLKAYRREALADVNLYGELHRFVPVLAAARGYRVTEVAVHHRPREFGVSKYGVSRILKGLMDLITIKFLTGYGDRPQHVLGGFGLVSFGLGSLGLIYLAIRWIVSRLFEGIDDIHLHETAALYYFLAMCLVGAQFLAVGLLGAMITASLSRHQPGYSVAEKVGDGSEKEIGG